MVRTAVDNKCLPRGIAGFGTGTESVPQTFVSAPIRVDNDDVFKFFRRSKIIGQVADANRVTIKLLRLADCQGFVIEGETSAKQNAFKELNDIVLNVHSESLTFKTNNMSFHETKEQLSCFKRMINEKFDVSAKFVIHSVKSADQTYFESKQGGSHGQTINKKVILKTETPKKVSWLFPGGYKISLINKCIEETTAVVVVSFSKWNRAESKSV